VQRADVPLGESVERYRVGVGTQTFEAFEPWIVIPAEALSGVTGTVTVRVVQVGDYAESRPVTTSITV
jgi:hypothetical protein